MTLAPARIALLLVMWLLNWTRGGDGHRTHRPGRAGNATTPLKSRSPGTRKPTQRATIGGRRYAAWLSGYLRSGGRVTHPLDCNFNPWRWLVLQQPIERSKVTSLYGNHSYNLIVPADANFHPADVPRTFHGQCGHSSIYFMADYQAVNAVVETFRDVRQMLDRCAARPSTTRSAPGSAA